jgi:hypothetical protein
VAVADVNGDGRPDLIVAYHPFNTVTGSGTLVLLNTTAMGAAIPSFAIQQIFANGSGPYSVAAADINGDGQPDLVVANQTNNTVSVLLNTTATGATTPTFGTQTTFATGRGAGSVVVADVNGDGKPDLVITSGGGVSVLSNTTATGATSPAFITQQTFGAGFEVARQMAIWVA